MSDVIHLFKSPDEQTVQAGFVCPGCQRGHAVGVKGGMTWSWNGSLDKPTFAPSVLVDANKPERRCHSFVREGRIEFLADCYHDLRGKTVDLPPYDEDAYFKMPPSEPKQ